MLVHIFAVVVVLSTVFWLGYKYGSREVAGLKRLVFDLNFKMMNVRIALNKASSTFTPESLEADVKHILRWV